MNEYRTEQVWEALREANLASGYVSSKEESRRMKIMFMAGYSLGQLFTQIRERSKSMDELLFFEMEQKQQEIINIINETCLTNCH